MGKAEIRQQLRRHRLAPSKRLGQNFLIHSHTAERIVALADIEPGSTVIEVGVGLGALTRPLAKRAGRVIGIEADEGLIELHRREDDLPENVDLIHGDILKVDLTALARDIQARLHIVANLPYSISSPFLFRLYEYADSLQRVVVMVQREVADRLLARPGTKSYGVPTVLLSSRAGIQPLLQVKPGEFHPRPKVLSTVIRMQFFPVPERIKLLDKVHPEALRKVVSAAFAQRRKTLANSLASITTGMDKKKLIQIITECGLSPQIRAERLEIADFIALTNRLWPIIGPQSTKTPISGIIDNG